MPEPIPSDPIRADPFPPEALLGDFSPPIRELAERLRSILAATAPGVVERVRPGWRLIGYDAPVGRRTRYFAWVFPERVHVHLGFVEGVLLHDPGRRLQGEGETKKARWLTWSPGDEVDAAEVAALVLEGLRVAALTSGERFARAMAMADDPTS